MNKIPHWIYLVGWCILGVLLWSSPSYTVLNHPSSSTDYWIPLSGAWALSCGVPLHTLASSPLGVLYYFPFEFVSWFIGMNERVIPVTQSLLFIIISTISFFSLRGRFPIHMVILSMIYFSLFATSPGNMGDSPFIAYGGISYDFLSIVIGQLAILVSLFPKNGKRLITDGFIIGLLLAWEFFIKPNLVVTDGFLILISSFILKIPRSHKFYYDIIASFGIFSILVIGLFHINIISWFNDLHMATQSRSYQIFTVNPQQYMGGNLTWGIAAVYSDVINRLNKTIIEWLPGIMILSFLLIKENMYRVAIFLGLVFLVDLFRTEFNSVALTWGFFWMLSLFFIYKKEINKVYKTILTILFSICILLWFTRLTVAFDYNLSAPKHFPPQAYQYPFATNSLPIGFNHVFFTRSGSDYTGSDYGEKINSGISLLEKYGLTKSNIFNFDFVNPFPILLNSQYPSGQPVWMDGGGTFNNTHHIPAEILFKGTDVILIPKHVAVVGNFQMMRDIYFSYILTNYIYIDQNQDWQLAKRKS